VHVGRARKQVARLVTDGLDPEIPFQNRIKTHLAEPLLDNGPGEPPNGPQKAQDGPHDRHDGPQTPQYDPHNAPKLSTETIKFDLLLQSHHATNSKGWRRNGRSPLESKLGGLFVS
jgi:hypothetical protein